MSEKGLAIIYQKENKTDSALWHALHALNILQNRTENIRSWGENIPAFILEVAPLVATLYKEKGQTDSAYDYLQLSVDLKDSLYNLEKVRQFQTLTFNEATREQQQLQKAELDQKQYETRVKMYGLLAGLLIVLAIAFLLYRNNKQKQKINFSLQTQKRQLENTLEELKRTQSQLIQSEKMASLGELTAGIAHEIQNPLNFVNNFSEVSTELVDEMNSELEKKNLDEAKLVARDLKQNLEKINYHGKRAGDIVKGMLQHSRISSGQKELTDINLLADEYLRLAYHGLRAKDKSFQANFETDFDKRIEPVNVIPQDVGRVLLNLINNAFYAVNEKSKSQNSSYQPSVLISTETRNGHIAIKVKDNGNGIPDKVRDKIFQPFFTTKPTGQGTGLGLSLSYDIIKAHGGDIKVKSKEAEGTEFIITIPKN